MCGPGLGWDFVVSGFPKLKPNLNLAQAGPGLVGLEPRLYM